MPFVMSVPDKLYYDRCVADNSDGRCAGQSVTWILDMLENKVDNCHPANLDRGASYHAKFDLMWDTHSRGGLAANEYLLKAVAYSAQNPPVRTVVSRSIQTEAIVTRDKARNLIDKLVANSGNAFLLMNWQDATSAHMMALMQKKHDHIYLYEPNSGVLLYDGDTSSLYDEMRQVLIREGILDNPDLRMSLLLTTSLDLNINR